MTHDLLEPSSLSPGAIYDLMAGLIVPRPIAFVSTLSPTTGPNLAPFSYFMPGGVQPPSLAFCPVRGPEGSAKDTLRNIEETGEFVVNLVTRAMADGMNNAAASHPRGVSEWPYAGFTPAASVKVKPARVLESPVQMECRLYAIVSHGDGAFGSCYVIGEILAFHTAAGLVENGVPGSFSPIARLGGSGYLDMDGGKLFDLPRPPKANRAS